MTNMSVPDPATLAALLNTRRGGFNEAIGLQFVSATLEEVVAKIELGPQHAQPYGIVHGGLYATMIETLCSTGAALQVFESGHGVVGLENHTSFLRASRGGVVTGTARPLKVGRRTQVWAADIADEGGRVLATGQVRLLVLEPDAAVAGETIPSVESMYDGAGDSKG